MKTKKFILKLSLLLFVTVIAFTACKKKQAFNDEDGQASVDNRDAQSENDAAVSDVNDVIGNQASLRGKGVSTTETYSTNICGLSLDTSGVSSGSIKLNYNGTTCNNRTRSGSIRLTILNFQAGQRWKMAGCILKVEYLGYKVVRASDGKSIELNGVQNITNETGGSWWELLIVKTQASLSTTIKGTNLDVTFSDGKTASYNINRKITYTLPGGIFTCTAEGIGSLNGLGSLENYGLTRDGDEFTSQVTVPIMWNLTCGPGAPIQGEVNIKVDKKEFDLKCIFSVDSDGNPMSAGTGCPYGWKVQWSYKKDTNKKVFPYN